MQSVSFGVSRSMWVAGAATLLLVACAAPPAPSPTAVPAPPKPTGAPAAPAPAPPQAAQPAAAAPTPPPAAPTAPTAQPGATQSAPLTSEQALEAARTRYYAAAQKEGKLVIYGTAVAPAYMDPIRAAFGKRFPGISIEAVEQSGSVTREKIIAEQAANSVAVDIAFTGYSTTRELTEGGFVEAYESPQVAQIIPQFVFPGGLVNPRNANLISVAVNTTLVPPDQEPKTWQDVLDPKWKGKLALLDPRGSGEGGSIVAGLEMVYGADWLAKLKAQQPFFGKGVGALWTGLARGEFAMYISARSVDAVVQRKQGAPVKFLKLQDGAAWTFSSMLNVKGQPHPNAARLFMEWTLSEEGQLVGAEQGFGAIRKGVKATEPETVMDGVVFLPRDAGPDADAKLGTDAERTARWDKLFFK